MAAQRLAARLMVELCGARMVGETVDAYPQPVEPRTIALRPARVARLLGVAVPDDEIHAILGRLGFGVAGGDPIEVTVPPWRWSDVEREIDLIEEVGRVYGLGRIPVTLPARRRAIGRLSRAQLLRRRLEDALRDRGLFEAISYSFTSPTTLERLRLPDDAVRLANPLSEDQSVMRPLLLPGLLDAARHNAAHGRAELRFFESAHVYTQPERHHLAALLPTFAETKGVLEAVLADVPVTARFEPGERPFLHPGRAASVVSEDGRELGFLGELHPAVVAEWDLAGGAAFEIDADLLAELQPAVIAYREVGRFPAATLDLALAVPDEVPYAEVEGLLRSAADQLERLELFDTYRGDQLPDGFKSHAFRLELRSPERTLTDDDLRAVRSEVERRAAELGGVLRAD
jgi:phenylalanyl-tRNA synthetase beta chain